MHRLIEIVFNMQSYFLLHSPANNFRNKDCILKYTFNQHSKCILIETLTFFRDLERTHKILGSRTLPSLTLQIHHCSLYKSLVLFYLLIFETNSLRGISTIFVAGQSYQLLVCAFFPPQVSCLFRWAGSDNLQKTAAPFLVIIPIPSFFPH